MAQRVQCPGCGKWLRIPDGVTEPLLSCPSCLAELPNPAVAPAAGIQTAPSAAAAGGIQEGPTPQTSATCPTCGEDVESSWRYCPVCHEDLRRPGMRRQRSGADVDVRRDQKGTSVFLILLAVLGGLGLVYAGGIAWVGLTEGTAWPLAILFALVLGFAALNVVRVYNRPQPPTGAQGVGRVFVHTLATIGCMFGMLILVGVASLIVLFIVCLNQGFKI